MSFKRDLYGLNKGGFSKPPVISDWYRKNDFITLPNGFGTVVSFECLWRRVGDSIQVKGYFIAGTVDTSPGVLEMPPGFEIDFKKLNTTTFIFKVGDLYQATAGTSSQMYDNNITNPLGTYPNSGSALDARRVYTIAAGQTGSNDGPIFLNADQAATNGAFIGYDFTVPIKGWELE